MSCEQKSDLTISIHAPREGSDSLPYNSILSTDISIHAPREGSDLEPASTTAEGAVKFLSTLPARGATAGQALSPFHLSDFYPRSPRGERRSVLKKRCLPPKNFYPRSPRGERHLDTLQHIGLMDFYPRSPRGERLGAHRLSAGLGDFYPRSPRGERPPSRATSIAALSFLSTLPARGATNKVLADFYTFLFLSTLPARGATVRWTAIRRKLTNFYPRSPRGERP